MLLIRSSGHRQARYVQRPALDHQSIPAVGQGDAPRSSLAILRGDPWRPPPGIQLEMGVGGDDAVVDGHQRRSSRYNARAFIAGQSLIEYRIASLSTAFSWKLH